MQINRWRQSWKYKKQLFYVRFYVRFPFFSFGSLETLLTESFRYNTLFYAKLQQIHIFSDGRALLPEFILLRIHLLFDWEHVREFLMDFYIAFIFYSAWTKPNRCVLSFNSLQKSSIILKTYKNVDKQPSKAKLINKKEKSTHKNQNK